MLLSGNSLCVMLTVYDKTKSEYPVSNKRRSKVPRAPPGLGAMIRRELARSAEKKFSRAAALTTARGTIAVADVVLITPTLAQGNTSATRVGNSIKITNFHVDILMCAEPSGTAQPFRCRVLVFKWKDGGNKLFASADATSFYNSGATDISGTGVWTDQVNRLSDRFDVLYDSITPVMQWQSSIPTAASPATNTKIVMSDHRRSFDVPYLRREITYDDADTVPSTSVFLVVQAIDTNNSQTNPSTGIMADVAYVLSVDYTDV